MMARKNKDAKGGVSDIGKRRPTTAKGKPSTEEAHSEEPAGQSSKGTSRRTTSMNQLGELKDFAKSTSGVVQKAASILEEEIAAGIVAAQRVEKRFINVNKTRSRKPDDTIQRFRRDSHELVDMLLDLVDAGTKYIDVLTQRVIRVRGAEHQEKSEPTSGEQIPTLIMPQSLKPGESAEVPMTLENDSDKSTGELGFHSTDLINASGDQISAEQITFTPPLVTIARHKTQKITVTASVPKGTPSGVYSGLIQATKLNQLRALLMVQVE